MPLKSSAKIALKKFSNHHFTFCGVVVFYFGDSVTALLQQTLFDEAVDFETGIVIKTGEFDSDAGLF